jgi:hypothetical protein
MAYRTLNPPETLALANAAAKAAAGSFLELQGAKMQAQGLIRSAADVRVAAKYNAQLANKELKLQLDAIGRQVGQVLGSQRAESAATGFSVGSPTALNVFNDTITQYERQVISTHEIGKQNALSIIREGDTQARALTATSAGILLTANSKQMFKEMGLL